MNKSTFNPELPIINPMVVLLNVPAEEYIANQRRAARVESAKTAIVDLTRYLLPILGLSQVRQRQNEVNLGRYYKGQADAKASRLIDNPTVSNKLLFNLGVQLDYHSGARLILEDGSSEDMSTVIKAYGTSEKTLEPKYIDWAFDVTNGIPECDEFRSLITYRTERTPWLTRLNEPGHEITGMQALDIETGQAYGPDDYPNPSLAQVQFYSLAERLFGNVEAGISIHEPPLTVVKGI